MLMSSSVILVVSKIKKYAIEGAILGAIGALAFGSFFALDGSTLPLVYGYGWGWWWGGGGWGWWWGGATLTRDTCPGGDFSGSFYDRTCGVNGAAPVTTTAGSGDVAPGTGSDSSAAQSWQQTTYADVGIGTPPVTQELIDILSGLDLIKEGLKDVTSFSGNVDAETFFAHQFALALGITTVTNIEEANLDGALTRAHMAKMFVEFARGVLGRTPDTTKVCNFPDMATQDADMQQFVRLACQMNIMGVKPDGSPVELFDPQWVVTRAQSATVLSRVIYGSRYDNGTPWYAGHLGALSAAGFITNTNPMLIEQRGFFMIMLQRAAERLRVNTAPLSYQTTDSGDSTDSDDADNENPATASPADAAAIRDRITLAIALRNSIL
jgi:hypothetical protein